MTPLMRSPILTQSVWRMLAACGVVIVGFGFLTNILLEVDRWEYTDWIYLGCIFGWTAMVATCCLARGRLGVLRLLVLAAMIVLASTASTMIDSSLWEAILPMLAIHAFLVWSISIAIGFPRWRTPDVQEDFRSRYSIAGMMGLTFAFAGIMVAARIGDLTEVRPIALVIFFAAAVGSWVLGCATFCLTSRRARILACLLLPALSLFIWILLQVSRLNSGSDELHVAVTLPLTQFGVAALVGTSSYGDTQTQPSLADASRVTE